jgi:hypothetical protein
MRAKELLTGLIHVGQAQGLRQTYDIFRGRDHFVVASMSRAKRRSGNFNLVEPEAVLASQDAFGGRKGVTSKMVRQRLARRSMPVESLEALNILYVLVALGAARVDRRLSQRALFFDFAAV